MKKTTLLSSIIIAITSILLSANSNAQTLVNQEWVTTGANPNYHFQYFNAASNNGYLYLVGNSYHTAQQENFIIGKMDDQGNWLWFREYNSISNYKDFGIDIFAKDSFIYVTGISWDSVSNNSEIVTMRIDDTTGNILWSQTWGSRYNVAVKVIADNAGNIYVGGTAQTAVSEFGMVVLKYKPTGSFEWESIYDSTGIMEGAVTMLLDSPQTNITITGYSGNTTNNWNFATIEMDAASGSIKTSTITNNGSGGFSSPVGISKDHNDATFIAGTVANPTTGKAQMKLIAYDDQWNVNFIRIWGDSTTSTEAADYHFDFNGGKTLLGNHTRSNGTKEIVLVRYESDPAQFMWARTIASPVQGEDAIGASFCFGGDNDNIYLTGSFGTNGHHRMITAAYTNTGDLLWLKEFNRTSTSDDQGKTIQTDELGNPMVTGVSIDADTAVYVSVKYDQWEKPNDYISDNNGKPLYMNKQLIVKFRKDMINKSFTDNTELQFASMGEVLKTWAYDTLHKRYPTLFNTAIKVEKIYKGLKSTYTTSIARNGDNIPVPDFWASLLIYIPNNAARSAIDWKDTLNARLFPLIEYANLNYTATLQSTCNPSANAPDDGFYKLNFQIGLNRTDVGIDVDSAWCLETGKPFVKVGVYDAGIDGRHIDLGGDGSHFFQKSKLWGWDFFNNYNLESAYPNYDSYLSHGTSIAGVIGAIRNNNEGIAGIAGGDFMANPDSSGMGVTLLGMKVANDELVPLSVLLNAYVKGVIYIPNSDYGYGINITNNSFGIILSETDTNQNNYIYKKNELLELIKVFHFSNRNQVSNFVSAGNDVSQIYYPANLYGDWVTCVGGSNFFGGAHHKGFPGSDPDWDAFIGSAIDVVAPSESGMTYSTNFQGGYGDNYNGNSHFATSIATAYATGTGALLKSYIDSSISHPRNLSPDDVEHIITNTAIDLDRVGKDDTSGYGRLNAGRALQYVNKNCRKIKHFTCSSGVVSNVTIVSQNGFAINNVDTISGNLIPIVVKLSEKFQTKFGVIIDTTPYNAIVYKVEKTCSIAIDSNCKILDYWMRNSSTNLFPLYDTISPTHLLQPYENASISFMNTNQFLLKGYIYELYDKTTGDLVAILGGSDSLIFDLSGAKFDFTVILDDTIHKCFDSVPLISKIDKIDNTINYSLYPNPTTSNTLLKIYSTKEEKGYLELTDLSGRVLKKENIHVEGFFEKDISVSEISAGLYILVLNFSDCKTYIKINKL